ncbi:MAG: protein translocase subunit SecD [Eubacteriaceae bacterium]
MSADSRRLQQQQKAKKTKKKMKTRTKSRIILAIVICLVAFCGYVLFHGVTWGIYDVGNIKDNMHYGLDLTGGVNVVLQASAKDGDISDDKMDSTVSALKNRIDNMGVAEATVAKQDGDRIRVSIPSVQNQQEALDMIGKTAELDFKSPSGDILLTGSDVTEAKAVKQTNNGKEEYVVSLKFSDEGTKKFADATQKYLNQVITIELDGSTISSPTVNSVISNGEAVIEGMSDVDEASNLASLINGGSLPLTLTPIQVTTVGPTLGADSLNQSIMAGGIGIAAVLIFMLVVYKGLGVIADIALCIYLMVDLWLMAELNVTLTLPGIAGLILSVGMAVDANVIIFERIQDEARQGRSYRSAIDNGFKRAIGTVMDSNITTLIAGFVLFFMGSGTVQGFAVTLILGIIISLLTAVVVTKYLIRLVVSAELFNNQKILGIKEALAA